MDFFVAANPKSPAATRCSLAHVHNVEHLEGKKLKSFLRQNNDSTSGFQLHSGGDRALGGSFERA